MENFTVGTYYVTPYGVVRCAKIILGRLASFQIIRPSEEATRAGYRHLDRFNAHPDDQTVPSPREWAEWDGK